MTTTLERPITDDAGLDAGAPRGPYRDDDVTTPTRRWRAPTRSGWVVIALAVFTTVLYTWSLSRVGYANSYYTAAVRAGAKSWKAFFFGSIDPGNFITVDKPPAALWLQELSVRLFGFSSWSMLLPEALAGVGSVLILHRLVRKWMGDIAAHIAGFAFALTPVAVLMFRYNNPDALLTLLCLGAVWALWSAIETGRTRALVLSAALLGLAFETKMMQAFLVVPAFLVVYLIAGRPALRKRIAQLFAALVALVVSSGWWVAIVALWPASARPYIGSTSDNSILSLIFGYNGLSRLFGGRGSAGGGGGGGTGFGGATGWLRLFNSDNAGNISWLLLFAAVGLAAGLWLTRRGPRTDRGRAGWLLWGGWAAACLAVFSLSAGTYHPYYTVQLAPAVAALAGAGGVALWRLGREHRSMRWLLPATVAASEAWAVMLLDRTPSYVPWLRSAIVVGAVLVVVGLWLGEYLRRRALIVGAAAVATVTLLAGPAAYAVTTVRHPQNGSTPAAGPTSSTRSASFGGGIGAATTSDTALINYLLQHQGNAKYLVATFGSQSSASIIIATGKAVITIGGFTGSDPAPTLAQFKALVANGEVKYVLVSSTGMGGGAGGSNSAIASWVEANGTRVSLSTSTATSGGTLYAVANAA